MNVQRISANEYLKKIDNAITIDLRTPAEYESEHLENSILLPVQNLDAQSFHAAINDASHSEAPIHLLCQSGRRADMALEKLKSLEDVTLVVIEGGLNSLKDAGVNTLTGKRKSVSLERQVRITAGALVLVGVVFGFGVHAGFFAVSAFVGAGLMFSGITDTCGMAMMLASMPWNKASKT